jgi:biopolymer transport protein ExbD
MRLSSRRIHRERRIELAMTSMIDVVFLLLIFFMLTLSFVRTERNLDSAIKVNQQASTAASRDLQPALVAVVRGETGYVYRLGGRDVAAEAELTDLLRQFDNKGDGAFVRAADGAPFRMAAAAIQACKTAGFGLVSYLPGE